MTVSPGPTWLPGLMLAAVLLAAGAAWFACGGGWPSRLRHAGVRHAGVGRAGGYVDQPGADRSSRSGRATFTAPRRAGLVVAVTAGALLVGGVAPVAGVLAVVVAALVVRYRAARARRTLAGERRQAVIDACVALSACLHGGASPEAALVRAAEESSALADLLGPVVGAARMGGDLPAALVRRAELPGARGLRRLAACWQVSAANGAALADTLERLTRGLRDDEAYRREVQAQLAGPRATARLLAALPFLGLALGAAAGANPLRVLLGTAAGAVCLVGGVLLVGLGSLWMRRLAAAVEPS